MKSNVEEELYYRFKVPERWDGISDPIINGYNYITGVEDVGDTFKFTFDYNCVDCMNGVLTDSVYSVDDEATIATGRTAQYTPYCLQASIPAATVQESGIFAGRVRRERALAQRLIMKSQLFISRLNSPWIKSMRRGIIKVVIVITLATFILSLFGVQSILDENKQQIDNANLRKLNFSQSQIV